MQNQQTESQEQEWIEELLPEDDKETIFHVTGSDVWNLVTDLIKKANVVKISIWHNEEQMVAIPIVYGGVMAILFPFISLFSVISLLALNCKVVVERR